MFVLTTLVHLADILIWSDAVISFYKATGNAAISGHRKISGHEARQRRHRLLMSHTLFSGVWWSNKIQNTTHFYYIANLWVDPLGLRRVTLRWSPPVSAHVVCPALSWRDVARSGHPHVHSRADAALPEPVATPSIGAVIATTPVSLGLALP